MFCAKEVSGRQPKRPETDEMRPSPAIAPDVSFAVGLRSSPTLVRAAVSPSTSTEETMYSNPIEMMEPQSNSA